MVKYRNTTISLELYFEKTKFACRDEDWKGLQLVSYCEVVKGKLLNQTKL